MTNPTEKISDTLDFNLKLMEVFRNSLHVMIEVSKSDIFSR